MENLPVGVKTDIKPLFQKVIMETVIIMKKMMISLNIMINFIKHTALLRYAFLQKKEAAKGSL